MESTVIAASPLDIPVRQLLRRTEMTDAQINEMVRKLRIAFGVETTDDLVNEMASRFLCWKLPKDFSPDAGISFSPTKPYDGDEYGNSWWPVGTNLLHAGQAEEMVRHMLGLPNAEVIGKP